MPLNIGQYEPSGDMMALINEYWSNRQGGSDHNAEWAGANGAEYWTRKYGEALNWKRNKLEEQARAEADETRKKVAQENEKWQQALKEYSDKYAEQNESMKEYFQQLNDQANASADATKNGLTASAGKQKEELSNYLTSLLGQYDTSFENVKGLLSDYQDNAYATQLFGATTAEDFAKAATSLLGTSIQAYNPNLYKADVSGLQNAYYQPDELMKQAQAKQQETYGYNPEKLKQVQEPYAQGYADRQAKTGQAFTGLGETITNADANVGKAGIYDQGTYNAQLSKEQSLSQQLRASEQGVLSQLNDMFNYASTYANKAESDYNMEKAGRLNERAAIQSQQYSSKLAGQASQAERGASQQVNNRRQNTNLSFNPGNQNLLSYLTRGY